jgi:hypothetical protein
MGVLSEIRRAFRPKEKANVCSFHASQRRTGWRRIGALSAPAIDARERLTPDQELAKIVKDRVPGKPVNCINLTQIRSTTIIDRTAIVYDMGGTIYVNRPPYPQSLDDDDILITRTWGSQLCNVDIVQLATRNGGAGMWWRGSVGLGEFVPYTKPKPAPAAAPATPPAG